VLTSEELMVFPLEKVVLLILLGVSAYAQAAKPIAAMAIPIPMECGRSLLVRKELFRF